VQRKSASRRVIGRPPVAAVRKKQEHFGRALS
jgi:hypothetical protein